MREKIIPELRWLDPNEAPHNQHNLIIAATVMCQCGKGAKVVLPAGRLNGEWFIEFDHAITIDGWMALPDHPHAADSVRTEL